MALSSMNGPRKGSRYHRLDDIPKDSFTRRTYQVELLDVALKRNTILCLGRADSKGFLALMVAKQLASDTRLSLSDGGKRTLYLTDSIDETDAIGALLPHHTDVHVGKFCFGGDESTNEDPQDTIVADIWQQTFEANSIIVTTGSLFLNALDNNYVNLSDVNLLIFDDCHKVVTVENHPFVSVVKKVTSMEEGQKRPHILGVTSLIAGTECSRPENLQQTISTLEEKFNARAETCMLILSERFGCRPKEFILECQELTSNEPFLADELEDIVLYNLKFFEECRITKDADVDHRDPTEIPIKVLVECLNVLEILGSWCTSSIAEYFIMQLDKIIKFERNDIHKKFLRCVCTTLRTLTKFFDKNFKPNYDVDEFLQYTTSKVREMAKILRNYKPEVDFMIINNDDPYENDEFSDMSDDNDEDEDEDSLMSGSDGEDGRGEKGKSSFKPMHIAVKRTADGGHERIMTYSEEEERNLCGVIFVQNHFIAFGLNKLIEEICSWDENLCFVKSSHIMGHGLRAGNSKQKSNKTYKRQEETLRKFRMQERNLLIATKELEEGIDIPKCNLVVCFDPPIDYRSYTLSKGRARARDASYYILLDEETHSSFSSNLDTFKGIEQVLLGENRIEESIESDDEQEHCKVEMNLDDILPPYSSGYSQVDMRGAIALINKYCAKLPSDAFTHLTPQCRVEKTSENPSMFTAYLRLPINSPVKEEIKGPEMPSRKLAERAVALKMCEILHKKVELDDNLVPVGKEMFSYEETEEWADEDYQDQHARPGTTKRKQYYVKKVADALIQSQPLPGQPCFLYLFNLQLTGRITDEQNTRGRVIYAPEDTSQTLGLLLSKTIPQVPCFPIYTRSGEVTASVDLLESGLTLTEDEIEKLLKFHRFVFTGVLHLVKEPMEFSPSHADIGCIIVPLDGADNVHIDWDFVSKVINFNANSKRPSTERTEPFEFCLDDFKDAVVMPSYRNIDQPQHFYVAEIRQDLNLLSPFPSPEHYKTFQDYYRIKYGLAISNPKQPLLDVDHTSARLNLLTPRYMNQKGVALPTSSAETKRARRENLQQKQILVPELCDVHVFPASLWRKTVCLPAVLYRTNCLLLAEELRCKISKETGIGFDVLPDGFRFPKLDFGFETSPDKLKEAESSEDKSVTASPEKEKEAEEKEADELRHEKDGDNSSTNSSSSIADEKEKEANELCLEKDGDNTSTNSSSSIAEEKEADELHHEKDGDNTSTNSSSSSIDEKEKEADELHHEKDGDNTSTNSSSSIADEKEKEANELGHEKDGDNSSTNSSSSSIDEKEKEANELGHEKDGDNSSTNSSSSRADEKEKEADELHHEKDGDNTSTNSSSSSIDEKEKEANELGHEKDGDNSSTNSSSSRADEKEKEADELCLEKDGDNTSTNSSSSRADEKEKEADELCHERDGDNSSTNSSSSIARNTQEGNKNESSKDEHVSNSHKPAKAAPLSTKENAVDPNLISTPPLKDDRNVDMSNLENIAASNGNTPVSSASNCNTFALWQHNASSISSTPHLSVLQDTFPKCNSNSSISPSSEEVRIAQAPSRMQPNSMTLINSFESSVNFHAITSSPPSSVCVTSSSPTLPESSCSNYDNNTSVDVAKMNKKNNIRADNKTGAINDVVNNEVLCEMPSISSQSKSFDLDSSSSSPSFSSSSSLSSTSSLSSSPMSPTMSERPFAKCIDSQAAAKTYPSHHAPLPSMSVATAHHAPTSQASSADSPKSSLSSLSAASDTISGFCQRHDQSANQIISNRDTQQNDDLMPESDSRACEGCDHDDKCSHQPTFSNQMSHLHGAHVGSLQNVCDKKNGESVDFTTPSSPQNKHNAISSPCTHNHKCHNLFDIKNGCDRDESHTDANDTPSSHRQHTENAQPIKNDICHQRPKETGNEGNADWNTNSINGMKSKQSSTKNMTDPAIIMNTLCAELNKELKIDLIEPGLNSSTAFHSFPKHGGNKSNHGMNTEWKETNQGWRQEEVPFTLPSKNCDNDSSHVNSNGFVPFSFSDDFPNKEKKDLLIDTWNSGKKDADTTGSAKISSASEIKTEDSHNSNDSHQHFTNDNTPHTVENTFSTGTVPAADNSDITTSTSENMSSSFPISVWQSEKPRLEESERDSVDEDDSNTFVVTTCSSTLGLDEDRDLTTFIGPSPCLILQALTMSNANDFFSLERLETIGDSFLKYAITVYLYCSYPGIHEGKLSYLRSKQVSNYNLYRLGRRKVIAEYMVSSKFEPDENWLPPGFIINNERRRGPVPKVVLVSSSSKSNVPSRNLYAEETTDANKQDEAVQFNQELEWIQQTQEADQKEDVDDPNKAAVPYCLQCQHGLPDKSVADCVEALIGCYLTTCGRKAALMFMSWLGLKVLPKKLSLGAKRENQSSTENAKTLWQQISEQEFEELRCPPSPMFFRTPENEQRLNYLLEGFDSLEERLSYKFRDRSYLLQAFTHTSYHYNTITDCYQRIEFLGDAILDYVITQHLYEDSQRYSPGILTDLRSALVNNNIFAALAVKWGFHCYLKAISPSLFAVINKFVTKQMEKSLDDIDFDEEYQDLSLEEGEGEDANEDDDSAEEVEMEIPKTLGDIFESVAGAIYLDSGMSLDTVWRVYYRMMKPYIDKYLKSIPKSLVRELLEREPETAKFERPERTINGKVRVTVNVVGKGVFSGIGRNYRIAKSAAAKKALRALRSMNQNVS